MLGEHEAIATLAVRDLAVARRFYEEQIGLEVIAADENSGVVRYRTGKTALMVYRSDFAAPGQATSVTFAVGKRVDAVVWTLADRGVTFERYEGGGARHEGHDGLVHVWGDFRSAWFKDPDGNLISVVSD